ncbi:stress responsive A/B barrel domain-containing protein [Phlyctochytrium arcticum]|nr:stress responsive A/B barrel domain-containing protein [Phlyctochytrium arcticum]
MGVTHIGQFVNVMSLCTLLTHIFPPLLFDNQLYRILHKRSGIVLFKAKTSLTPDKLAEFVAKCRSLTKVPGVNQLNFGPTFKTERAKGYTHALVVQLADKTALGTYAADPYHVEVLKNHILPSVEEDGILAMDIE